MLPQTEHLSDVLRQHCALRLWEPHHIPQSGPANETQLLLELIACRNAGHADLSLELIEIGKLNGWKSSWLDDNRARAEFDLGRPQRARTIWEQLARGDDPEAAAVAKTALKQFGALLPQANHLSDAIRKHCALRGWLMKHIPNRGPTGETQFLLEIISCRDNNRSDLSLELIEIGEKYGWSSPWLDDNRARAEFHLNRPGRALAIWEKLTTSEDANVAATAKATLNLIQNSLKLQQKLHRCCDAAGWQPRHLGKLTESKGIDLQQALEEISICREAGASQLSQQLIDCCRKLCFDSPWIDDNHARLILSKQPDKAKEIWESLLKDERPEVRAAATQALTSLHDRYKEIKLQIAIEAAKELGEKTPWRKLLLQRRLDTDGAASPSWQRESIQLGLKEEGVWDQHLNQIKLFQQLAYEQVEHWQRQGITQ